MIDEFEKIKNKGVKVRVTSLFKQFKFNQTIKAKAKNLKNLKNLKFNKKDDYDRISNES